MENDIQAWAIDQAGEIPGSQAAMGCTCGQPRTVGVMHRSEGPCQAVYATVPVAQAKPDLSGLTRYDPSISHDSPCMDKASDGEWVKFGDVEALLAHPVTQAKPEGEGWQSPTNPPDDDLTVLLALSDGEVWSGFHEDGQWRYVTADLIESCQVIAWMHMPAPPTIEKGVMS